MKASDMIKDIRHQLKLSQTELAELLGISFATVNRWEKGHCEPSQIALTTIRRLCCERGIDYERFAGNSEIVSSETVTLYHGTRTGITGAIDPKSHCHCDFGSGFYMATDPCQAKTLICGCGSGLLYTLELDLTGLKILELDVPMDWALFVAYNRGRLDQAAGTCLYKRMQSLAEGYDLLIGPVVDEKSAISLEKFYSGEITDEAMLKSLPCCRCSKQYVALTDQACRAIRILEEQHLSEDERLAIREASIRKRADVLENMESIWKEYRRCGRYFDEIQKAGV